MAPARLAVGALVAASLALATTGQNCPSADQDFWRSFDGYATQQAILQSCTTDAIPSFCVLTRMSGFSDSCRDCFEDVAECMGDCRSACPGFTNFIVDSAPTLPSACFSCVTLCRNAFSTCSSSMPLRGCFTCESTPPPTAGEDDASGETWFGFDIPGVPDFFDGLFFWYLLTPVAFCISACLWVSMGVAKDAAGVDTAKVPPGLIAPPGAVQLLWVPHGQALPSGAVERPAQPIVFGRPNTSY